MGNRFYEFGPFRVDKLNHLLLRDGKALPLKPKVFDTLLVLVEARDRVLDKDELMSRLWPDAVVEESNLSQNIYLLRKALGETDHGDVYIDTVPKRGYRFVADVREVADKTADRTGIDHFRPPDVTFDQNKLATEPIHTQSLRMKLIAAVLILCIVALAIVLGVSYSRMKGESAAAHGTPVRSIAVLPFKSLSSDAADEALGFGLADTLIIRLSSFRQFEVRSIGAVRKFGVPQQDPNAAGRELNVDAVLDATIQREGEKIRVNLRLIRVSDGSAVWAGKIDEQGNDLLGMQDRIAEHVARELVPQMTGEDQKLLAKRFTDNSEAYQLYMRGRYHWNKYNSVDWTKAVAYFNQAIEKDPTYALAYTGLADAYLSPVAEPLMSETESIPKAKQAALTALRLDDTLAEAHVSLGRIKSYYDTDWDGAEVEFKRAIELNPNSADAHREFAGYLTTILRVDEAVAEATRARELDPLSQLANFHLVWALISARRYDEAIAESQRVLGTFPQASLWMGWAYIGKKQYDDAVTAFEKWLNVSKDDLMTKAHLGFAYGVSGKRTQAQNILADFKTRGRKEKVSPYFNAIIQAGLGHKDQTFALLGQAYEEHSRNLVRGVNVNPVWDSFRSDPRFAELLRRMKFSH